jgi:hypothetical protein
MLLELGSRRHGDGGADGFSYGVLYSEERQTAANVKRRLSDEYG